MVEPLRHVGGLGDLSDDEAMRLGWLMNRLSRVQKAELGAEHVYAFVFGGAPPTRRTPPHLHLHLVPRYPGTPREHWGLALSRWSDAPRVDSEAMGTLITRLRNRLDSDS
jgi:diadenosine tetraphosphate (Ap4A) HIT family hydrolase